MANTYSKGKVEFLGGLVDLAPDCQLEFPFKVLAEPLDVAAELHGPIVEQLTGEMRNILYEVETEVGNEQRQKAKNGLLNDGEFQERKILDQLKEPYAVNQIAGMRLFFDGLIIDLEHYSERVENWTHEGEQTSLQTLGAFLIGKKWTNNSAIQDRYGLLPLLAGSFIISLIAIAVAVPIGLSAAIYVNQIAGPGQQKFLKPVVEFIESVPSIVLGFLGIAVFSGFLKDLSESAWIDWMPGLPVESRLNMLTAALLLAFMAHSDHFQYLRRRT